MDKQPFYRFKREELAEVSPSQLKKGDSIALGKQNEEIYGVITIDDVWPIGPSAEYVTVVYTLPKGANKDSHSVFIRIDGTTSAFPIIEVTQKIQLDKIVLIQPPHKTPS